MGTISLDKVCAIVNTISCIRTNLKLWEEDRLYAAPLRADPHFLVNRFFFDRFIYFLIQEKIWRCNCKCFWIGSCADETNRQQRVSRHQVLFEKNKSSRLTLIYYCSEALYSYNECKLAHIKELEQVSSSLLPSLTKIQVKNASNTIVSQNQIHLQLLETNLLLEKNIRTSEELAAELDTYLAKKLVSFESVIRSNPLASSQIESDLLHNVFSLFSNTLQTTSLQMQAEECFPKTTEGIKNFRRLNHVREPDIC